MILYRDHRSLLADSMETVRKFYSIQDMLEYVSKEHHGVAHIDDMEFTDERIGWLKCHYVCVDECIRGMCNLGEINE